MSAIVDRWDGADVDDDDYEAAQIDQDAPSGSLAALRIDFGAHLEANYQRLVAQLYAITLDPGEAHDVVQDAYSRAWRNWATISRKPDPTASPVDPATTPWAQRGSRRGTALQLATA